MTTEVLSKCYNNAYCRTTICHYIHNTNRIKLHGKNLHCNSSKLFRFLIHLVLFTSISLVYFQCCKTMQILQKRISKTCVYSPIFTKKPFCNLLNHHYCSRNKRNAFTKASMAKSVKGAINA